MLTVKDLMVGDYVYLINTIHNVSFPENGVIQDEGYTTTRTPIKITTVSENCVSYYSDKLKSYITLSSDEIEPIQVTPEILEKNGFETHSSNLRMLLDHDDYRLCYYLNSSNRFSSFNNIDGSLVQKVIVNVHELQHALKLCRIDKEIVL